MSKKFSGYNQSDTKWDNYHKANNMMANREFFSSNAKGGLYEGMEWDGDEWVPNEENRKKQADIDAQKCQECGCMNCVCW